jgi:two-component system NtrC family sensor kinase
MTDNHRILIVDDELAIRRCYEDFLSPASLEDLPAHAVSSSQIETNETAPLTKKGRKYHLTLAETGEEAIKAVAEALDQNRRFAAAFVDMKMPGIDGAETSRRIWAIDPKIKIVIVTAFSEFRPHDIVDVTGRGDLFYLRKPFHPGEIEQFARALTNQWNLEHERASLSEQLKLAYQEVETINKNLQKKIIQQSALLIQSEKMASIGTLAAGVAHEINNPISFVNSNLLTIKKYCERIEELLRKYAEAESFMRELPDTRAQGLLNQINAFKKKQKIDFIMADLVALAEESVDGTRRVSRIVDDLKSFSRVDQGELKYIDVNEAMEATLNIIRNELKYRVKIVKDWGEVPKVKCFPQRISQVFMNILVNAAQAIEEKGTIRIASRYKQKGQRAEDRCVEITVSDTGCGIPQDDLLKIFDPFFSTKPVGQGTGLGLSITYDIVKSHGGNITVESLEGEGTTFTITLPLEPKG